MRRLQQRPESTLDRRVLIRVNDLEPRLPVSCPMWLRCQGVFRLQPVDLLPIVPHLR